MTSESNGAQGRTIRFACQGKDANVSLGRIKHTSIARRPALDSIHSCAMSMTNSSKSARVRKHKSRNGKLGANAMERGSAVCSFPTLRLLSL